jgi:ABC-type Zn uptake system ZnuABC Zn-binding protein ZnuA
MKSVYKSLFFVLSGTLLVAGCALGVAKDLAKLRVVATTSILGDVVANVGGDLIELTTLLPSGSDPHAFQPAPQDIALIAEADVVFINGLGLEEFLEPLLENAGGSALAVSASEGIAPIALESGEHDEGENGYEEDEHAEGDPHVWMDPNQVMVWVDNIEAALSEQDPANASAYQSSAAAYKNELQELDAWIVAQLADLLPERRKLVTDHDELSYFAARYEFEVIGAVIPGYSTVSEPTAQELAALEDAIRALNVPAIFVDTTVNPVLAQRIAQDTGTQLAPLYLGSLSDGSGPAASYLALMRHTVTSIVAALR